jgi:hypothetical protein
LVRELPTSGSLTDKEYFQDVPACKETRFVMRFMMTAEEAIAFMDEMLERGAIRIRAEAHNEITFVEPPIESFI